jgi:hypothetical protein
MYRIPSSPNRDQGLSRPAFHWSRCGSPQHLLPARNLMFALPTSNETSLALDKSRGSQCIRFGFLIFALAFPVNSNAAAATAPWPESNDLTQVNTQRVAVGSVADILSRSENNRPITIVHILEFKTDDFWRKPPLLTVRLCGDHSGTLEPAVHTNIILIYDIASPSRLTGCVRLISSEPWQDNSKWQTVTFTSSTRKRSVRLAQPIKSIVNGSFAK